MKNYTLSDKQRNTIKIFANRLAEYASQYDYIVATTRRCFCLLVSLSFSKDFAESINIEVLSKIISSQSIHIHGKSFEGKKVLICDDIMIHGQSVLALYNDIREYHPSELNVFVMLRNIETPDYFKYKTEMNYDVVDMVSDQTWKHFSSSIVQFIHDNSVLYISYIYGFKLSKEYLSVTIDKYKDYLHRFEIDEGTFKESNYSNGCEPCYYIIDNINEIFGLSDSFNYIRYAVLRVYKNPIDDSCWVVPYVELKDIYVDGLKDLWSKITRNSKLSEINNSTDIFKSLTALISWTLYVKMFGENSQLCDTSYIDSSYFDGFASCFKEIDIGLLFDLAKNYLNICEKETDVDRVNSIMLNTLQQKKYIEKMETPNILLALYSYFALVSLGEDENFKELSKGITIDNDCIEGSTIFEKMRVHKFNQEFMASFDSKDAYHCLIQYMLYFMDTGVVSVTPKIFIHKGAEVVGLFVKSGEQSFHLFADIARNLFKSVYFLNNYINNSVSIEKKKTAIKEILSLIKRMAKTEVEYYAFNFILSNNIGDLQDYYFGGSTKVTEEANDFFIQVCNGVSEIKKRGLI